MLLREQLFLVFFILVLVRTQAQTVVPQFSFPAAVCAGELFNITNTTAGGSTFKWKFCAKDLNRIPASQSLGSFSGWLDEPTYMDIVFNGANYYGFVTNFSSGDLIRLDFGNSLLNNPTAVNLGNINGLLPGGGNAGIQVAQDQGKWYAIIVSGYPPGGINPRISKIDFGTNITNPNPVGTNWGNEGNMYDPNDLILVHEGNTWVALTVNGETNTVSRFNFGSSLNNSPTGNNLGNLGNLGEPAGLYLTYEQGEAIVFITNSGDKTRIGGMFDITRLNFGSSLLNNPTAVNIGNVGNMLQHPRDLALAPYCNQTLGFVLNGHPFYNSWLKLDFNNDIFSFPSPTEMGDLTGFDYPHCIEGFFYEGENIIAFVVNKNNSTISRVVFADCNNASIPSSSSRNPPPISYNQAGIYNIQLIVDEGLPSEMSLCKQIVITSCTDTLIITNDTTICGGVSLQMQTGPAISYQWSPATYLDDPASANPVATPSQSIKYYVDAVVPGDDPGELVQVRDSVTVNVRQPFIVASNDTTICEGSSVQLNAEQGAFFTWSPSTGLSDDDVFNPVATPVTTTEYVVAGRDPGGCLARDTVVITVNPSPGGITTADTIICSGAAVQLNASGGNTYQWSPASGLNDANIANPVASASGNVMYRVRVTAANQCVREDSVRITVRGKNQMSATAPAYVCAGDNVTLIATGGDVYQWTPTTLIADATAATVSFVPQVTATYTVNIRENVCNYDTSIRLTVDVKPLPSVNAVKSNDVNCSVPSAQLEARGAGTYLWAPANGLSDPTIARPIAAPDASTAYIVTGTDEYGCASTATVNVNVDRSGVPRYLVPNAFTPNGDGKNDCFGIQRWGTTMIKQFSVYNRWGTVVFSTTNASQCWDGTWQGKPQAGGGYIYVISAETLCGEVMRKGVVTLIR